MNFLLKLQFSLQAAALSQVAQVKSNKLQSEAVRNFLNAIEDAQPDLQWIQDTVTELRQSKRIVRQDLLDSRFGVFEQNELDLELLNTGDSWYKNFREKECETSKNNHGYCSASNPVNFDPWTEIPVTDFSIINDHNFMDNDFYMKSKNMRDLYEESEFQKLSKFEQEESEPIISDVPEEKIQTVRHVFNPESEIKLKISSKFINRGLSAVLPSGIYEQGLVYEPPSPLNLESVGKRADSVLNKSPQKLPNYDVFKRNDDITKELRDELGDISPEELKSEYDDVVKEFKQEREPNNLNLVVDSEENLSEKEYFPTFPSRKLLTVVEKEENHEKMNKNSKSDNDPLHLKKLAASAEDVHVEMHKPDKNVTFPQKENNQKDTKPETTLPKINEIPSNLTINVKISQNTQNVRRRRFKNQYLAAEEPYSYEDFTSGKAMTQIIEVSIIYNIRQLLLLHTVFNYRHFMKKSLKIRLKRNGSLNYCLRKEKHWMLSCKSESMKLKKR